MGLESKVEKPVGALGKLMDLTLRGFEDID